MERSDAPAPAVTDAEVLTAVLTHMHPTRPMGHPSPLAMRDMRRVLEAVAAERAKAQQAIDDEFDDDEPVPGFDVSPFDLSPRLATYLLRHPRKSAPDRHETADLITRLLAELETAEAEAKRWKAEHDRLAACVRPSPSHPPLPAPASISTVWERLSDPFQDLL